MVKIFVWGTGQRTELYISKGFFSGCDIIAFIQTELTCKEYMNKPVITPDEAGKRSDEVDYIVINNQFIWEIFGTYKMAGIPNDKLIITDNVEESPFDIYFHRTKKISPSLYEWKRNLSYRIIKSNETDHIDTESFVRSERFKSIEYRNEYVRFRTFELVAKEIKENNIEGAMAELGVFNGTFAGLINAHFPNRKLYLFDTFEGFNQAEASYEIDKGRCKEEFIANHRNPSIDILKGNIINFDSCVICKGLFPDSITDDANKEYYAFVSLDVDFEESTYQGLKFFYPRLVNGGYIFLHDYNTFYLEGVRVAVQRFEEENDLRLNKVPIADRAGTLVIVK